MSIKVTPKSSDNTITVRTQTNKRMDAANCDWWNANSKKELAEKALATVTFLKQQDQNRMKQNSMYARMYGNFPLFGLIGSSFTHMNPRNTLPVDRPTMSVITSMVDTLVSRVTQEKPRPVFLTDNADYRKRNLAKQLNQFINGEFYQTKAYQLGALAFRDAAVLGTGVIKVLESQEKKVSLERRLNTELYFDPSDSFYGDPRQLSEVKLVDRSVLQSTFPKSKGDIERAEQALPESGYAGKTISDLIMVAELWHLESGPDYGDGLHIMVSSEGLIFDKPYTKKRFPFAWMHYSPQMVGVWGQGIPERQFGTQMEINKILMTISQSINLVGVPRVFVEEGSKVVGAHLNNNIGAIVKYRGTKPIYEVAPCVPQEMYEQLQRLVNYAYQSEGISQLAASSQKPSGLTAAAALREYDDLQSDRFAQVVKRYQDFYADLAYLIIDLAKEIAERDGKYETIYPNKDSTKEVCLPEVKLLEDPFVIQCFDSSSLPRDPAGRAQKIIEYMQAGLYSPQEGRRLLGFADTEQVDKLEVAGEERILKILDQIIEDGKMTPPDPFMDLQLAEKLTIQYYNLYALAKMEDDKIDLLLTFLKQIQALKTQAMTPPPGMPSVFGAHPASMMPGGPRANPQPLPQSPMLPNVPQSA